MQCGFPGHRAWADGHLFPGGELLPRTDRLMETHPLSPLLFRPYIWQVLSNVVTHLILKISVNQTLSPHFKKMRKLN